MKGRFSVEESDQVDLTLTATMRAYDWHLLAKALSEGQESVCKGLGFHIEEMLVRLSTEVTGDATFEGVWDSLEDVDG